MNVGPPRLDIQPLRPDGNIGANVRGNHRGPSAGLNVHNPQPGMHYYHVRHPNADRQAAQYRRFYAMGYRPVTSDDPEYTAEEADLNLAGVGIKDFHLHKDTLLMKVPEERYREQQEFAQSQRDAEVDGPTNEFLGKAHEFDHNYGARAEGPIFYKGPGHGNTTS
jgi:hypothetical protein